MYFKLKKGKLREIVFKAIGKAGTIRKLESKVGIPKSNLSYYLNEKWNIREENLIRLLNFLGTTLSKEDIIKELPLNWRQIIGGKKCVEIKKRKGILKKQMKECRNKRNNFDSLKLWHKKMKMKNPEKYHLMQYERFKKVGNYKYITDNGERVRNKLEKDVADLLRNLGINYKYEPLIKAGDRYFFPDFVINDKIIIECTEWRGTDKAIKLKDKIKYLKKKYKVYVIIPKALKSYYEILNHHLLLGIDELVKVISKSR